MTDKWMTLTSPRVFVLAVSVLLAVAVIVLTLRWIIVRGQLNMPAEDKAVWRTAASLTDVAALTARWLTGELRGQPGYCGPVDVDEEDAPGMTAVLIACNQAGLLTCGSQAGYDGTDPDGVHWQQLAAIEGLISGADLVLLRAAITDTGVMVDAGGEGQAVTFRQGQRCTTFGVRRTDLADTWTGYGICSPAAVAELQRACPVVIYDPEPGRNDRLWPALAIFAEQYRGRASASRPMA